MSASYPGSVKVFTTKVDAVDVVDASDINAVQDEVRALENILGVNPAVSTSPSPSGSFTTTSVSYATLADRLANIETGIVSDAHSQYLRVTGGGVIIPANASTIGVVIKAAGAQVANLFELRDNTNAVKAFISSAFDASFNGALVVGNGASITGNVTVSGTVTAKDTSLSAAAVGSVPLTLRLLPGATGDAFDVRDSNNAVLASIDNTGTLHVPNLVVTGSTTSGTTLYSSAIDVSTATSTAAATGTGLGDKIMMYAAKAGFGMQSNRVVAYVDTGMAFSVRPTSGTGAKSSGTDAVTLYPYGRVSIASTGGTDSITTSGGTHTLGGNVAITGTTSSSTPALIVTTGLTIAGGTNLIEARAADNSVQFSVKPDGTVKATSFLIGTTSVALQSQVPGLVVKPSAGSWPATRPTGFPAVIWIGSTDPGSLALSQDVWIQSS